MVLPHFPGAGANLKGRLGLSELMACSGHQVIKMLMMHLTVEIADPGTSYKALQGNQRIS
jgi:hypothetical protein